MEAIRTNADFRFFMQWPFGLLMGGQTFFSLISLILFYFAPFLYEGTHYVRYFLCIGLVSTVINNIIHIFGWHRKVYTISNRQFFIPACFMVFLTSAFGTLIYGVSTLTVFIGFVDSLRFTVRLMVIYALLTVTIGFLTFTCVKVTILLLRAAPNGQLKGLLEVVIEGDRTTRLANSRVNTGEVSCSNPATTANLV